MSLAVGRIRFQTDEDFDGDVIAGLRRREPRMDLLTAVEAGLRGQPDPVVLAHAADQDRVLLSYDRSTMPGHFYDFLATGRASPGLMLLDQQFSIANAIEAVILVWEASGPDEWRNLIAPTCRYSGMGQPAVSRHVG